MKFDILTLFPEVFEPYLSRSILGRARAAGLIETNVINIRDYAADRHRTVDDTPYGGGPGMVMKVEPIDRALSSLNYAPGTDGTRGILLSARGSQFTQRAAAQLAQLVRLVLVCGRYEGVDQRVADHLVDEELSIGPYVLAGGELAALVVLEATARLIPGVLGNPQSLAEESYTPSLPREALSVVDGRSGEYPHYTKPEAYRGWQVPDVLLSGNHQQIDEWRRQQRRRTSAQSPNGSDANKTS